MDNALIIDLVLAAVLAVFALLGARKGLIRSLMALVSVVVALIGATLLTAMFVEPVTDLVYPKVEERVLEQFERDIPSDALAAEDGDLSAGGLLPDELSDLLGEALDTLKRFGVSDDAIDGVTKSVTDSAVSAAERAAYLLVKTIVQAALFLAFFLALMLLLRLLTHGLDRLFSLPVLAQLQRPRRRGALAHGRRAAYFSHCIPRAAPRRDVVCGPCGGHAPARVVSEQHPAIHHRISHITEVSHYAATTLLQM